MRGPTSEQRENFPLSLNLDYYPQLESGQYLNLDIISFKPDILHKDYHWHKLALQTPEQH